MKILDTARNPIANLLTWNIFLTAHKIYLNHKQALLSVSE